MAIFIPGMKCPLCGLPIEEGEQRVLFPSFVSNSADPLWRFSDGAFHAACVSRDPLGQMAVTTSAKALVEGAPGRRLCVVCGNRIDNPDDYLSLGYLTSDPLDPLYEFNYRQFHLAHVSLWRELDRFVGMLKDFRRRSAGENPPFEWLLKRLTSQAKA